MATLRAEATFSWYEMASKKQPLPKTIQISIVHVQNSSRDSQATGSSSLCEFRGNQNCENYLRTTLLELSFCFSALPPLVLSILAEKHFLGSSFLEKYYYVTNFSKSCLLSGELNSNWQFFPDYSGLLIFRSVADPRNSGISAKSREIPQKLRNTAKSARNISKYMSAKHI